MKDFAHGGNLRQLAQAAGLPERDVLDFGATETVRANLQGKRELMFLKVPLVVVQGEAAAHWQSPPRIRFTR